MSTRNTAERVRELHSLPATFAIGEGRPQDPAEFGDTFAEEYDASLRKENDARELAIYGELLMDMRILRRRGFGVWLDAECSEVAEEFGCERMFNVGTAPRFSSEMHDMAERVRGELIDGVKAANDNSPYGFCPRCGAKGVMRERRPNGNDRCENEHSYPSSKAING